MIDDDDAISLSSHLSRHRVSAPAAPILLLTFVLSNLRQAHGMWHLQLIIITIIMMLIARSRAVSQRGLLMFSPPALNHQWQRSESSLSGRMIRRNGVSTGAGEIPKGELDERISLGKCSSIPSLHKTYASTKLFVLFCLVYC